MVSIILIVLLFRWIFVVNASHFLGGTITWHPLNASATGTYIDIVITQTYSWTYSIITCTNAMISSYQLIPSSGYSYIPTQTLDCIYNCASGSTGYVAPSIRPYCTDISAPVGTTVGQRSDVVHLKVGDDFAVAFQQNAWRTLTTASSADWSIATRLIIEPRSDNGLYNNAPVATMMSPVNIPVNQKTVINIPVADADGDITRCRWSTSSAGIDECGGVCPPSSLPPSTIIYPNCTIVITGQSIGDWFAVTLMVEDFINPSSTIPLSSVPVQFLVHVVGPQACATPPEVIGIPEEQSCTALTIGQTFTSQLIANNYCGASVTILDIATLSFPGMVRGTLTALNVTTYYNTMQWTPTTAQLGYQVMCAMAFDSQNSQSAQYCFKFYVSQIPVCVCPGDVCITTTTTATTSTLTSTTVTTSSSTSATTSTTSSTTSTTTTTSTTSTSTTSSTTTSSTSSSSSSSTSTTTSTSTTSTSSTSTSATTTSTTTATTTTREPEPINWPLIGPLTGLAFLATLGLCCYLCWRYCCPLGGRGLYERNGTFEFYHIERCTDPDCHWSNSLCLHPSRQDFPDTRVRS